MSKIEDEINTHINSMIHDLFGSIDNYNKYYRMWLKQDEDVMETVSFIEGMLYTLRLIRRLNEE